MSSTPDSRHQPLLSDDELYGEGLDDAELGSPSGFSSPIEQEAEVSSTTREARAQETARLSRRNLVLALVCTLIIQCSQGVWGYAVLGPYIEHLTDSNSKVGYAEGIQGIFKAVLAIPAGIAADRWSRSKVIRSGSGIAVIAGVATMIALFMNGSDMQQYGALTAALALWGAFDGAITSPMQALYADSTPLGQRDVGFLRLFAAQIVGTSAGPIMNAILFTRLGNEWSQSQLRVVFTVGIIVGVPGYILLSFFRDLPKKGPAPGARARLLSEGPGINIQDAGSRGPVVVSAETISEVDHGAGGDALQAPLLAGAEASASEWLDYNAEDPALDPEDSDEDEAGEEMLQSTAHPDIREGGPGALLLGRWRWKWLTVDKIPLITAVGDITFGIASGMTIKFFPLFFKNECEMRPVTVNVVYVLMPLSLVAMTYLAQYLSRFWGRVQLSVLTHYLGVALLFLMVILKPYWTEAWIIVPVYLLRTALMNCGYPLIKSILMDSVTSAQRAKWNSLESVSSFGWSGSAALGGVLLDHFGYSVTLNATAVLQLIATVWTMLLLPLVPAKQVVRAERVPSVSRIRRDTRRSVSQFEMQRSVASENKRPPTPFVSVRKASVFAGGDEVENDYDDDVSSPL